MSEYCGGEFKKPSRLLVKGHRKACVRQGGKLSRGRAHKPVLNACASAGLSHGDVGHALARQAPKYLSLEGLWPLRAPSGAGQWHAYLCAFQALRAAVPPVLILMIVARPSFCQPLGKRSECSSYLVHLVVVYRACTHLCPSHALDELGQGFGLVS